MADEPLSRVEEILEGGSPPLLSRIEKLLKEGGAGGGVSPEQIAAAVEAYLNEHGVTVTETDPTVPEWAKAEQKPSYTATEVGALPNNTYIPPDAVWCGEWNSSRQYNIGDFVSYNGTIYRCEIPGIGIYPDEEQGWTEWFNASTLNALTQHQDISGKSDKVLRIAKTAQDTTATIDPNKLYVFPEMASLTITLAAITDSTIINEYHFFFTSGSTATVLTLPASVLQPDGFTVEANMHYEISILEGAMTAQGWAVTA